MKSIRLFILLLNQLLTVFAQQKLIKVSKWSSYGSWPPSKKYVALINIKSLDPIDILHDLRNDLNDLINVKDFSQSLTVNPDSNQQSSLPSVNTGSPPANKIQKEATMLPPSPPAVIVNIPPPVASIPVSKKAAPSEMPHASNKKSRVADKAPQQVSEPVLKSQRNIANAQSNIKNKTSAVSMRTSTNANIPNQSQLNKEPFRAIRS